jgi:RsiW-degrading membrane proteinase PrsW (M82 family)
MATTAAQYASYDQVPTFRKQWVFWLLWVAFAPAAVVLLLTGDIYYVKKGEVRKFGMANRVLAGLIALLWMWQLWAAFVGALATSK